MNKFLDDIKDDLRDRRLLPLVLIAGALLIGALAFAVLGGGSSSATPAAAGPHRPAGAEGGNLAVIATHSSTALAETTSGVAQQHKGGTRDPFSLLPGTVVPAASASSSSGSQSSSKGSGSESSSTGTSNTSSSSGSSGGGEKPSAGSKSGGSGGRSQPSKPKTVYQVSALFGEPSTGTAGEESELKPYVNLKLLTPLPSSHEPLVVFRGVSNHGKLATFTVAGETILHGNGKCLPSAYQCQAIQLRAGQSEQLQYLPPGSQTVQSYELRLVSITPVEASAATVASLWRAQSHEGMQVLRRTNLVAIPGLGFTTLAGVLVATS